MSNRDHVMQNMIVADIRNVWKMDDNSHDEMYLRIACYIDFLFMSIMMPSELSNSCNLDF